MQTGSETDETPTTRLADKDVAIVHDWFPELGGGEKVVLQMSRCFPKASIYTLFDFLNPEERALLSNGCPIHVSRLNKLPGVKSYYRYLLLHCTRAIEEFNVTRHEFVLSSSAALSKGVITSPAQKHFSYVHSPARYAWDLTHEYIDSIGGAGAAIKKRLAHRMMHRFRIWDMRTVPSVDHIIANSEFIRKRIWKVYRRDADVIYPPVDTGGFTFSDAPRQEHFLTASRMVPYKRMPMIMEAFSRRPKLKLRVVGDGPDMGLVRAAAGPNVEILGRLPFEALKKEMQLARAFVFAAQEDFGIMPLEAQACGTPVIALGHGGTAETVRPLGRDKPTGVWFKEQTVESLLEAIDQFVADGETISAQSCRDNALSFSDEQFRKNLMGYIDSRL